MDHFLAFVSPSVPSLIHVHVQTSSLRDITQGLEKYCQGTNAKGRPCGNPIRDSKWMDGERYCPHHEWQGLQTAREEEDDWESNGMEMRPSRSADDCHEYQQHDQHLYYYYHTHGEEKRKRDQRRQSGQSSDTSTTTNGNDNSGNNIPQSDRTWSHSGEQAPNTTSTVILSAPPPEGGVGGFHYGLSSTPWTDTIPQWHHCPDQNVPGAWEASLSISLPLPVPLGYDAWEQEYRRQVEPSAALYANLPPPSPSASLPPQRLPAYRSPTLPHQRTAATTAPLRGFSSSFTAQPQPLSHHSRQSEEPKRQDDVDADDDDVDEGHDFVCFSEDIVIERVVEEEKREEEEHGTHAEAAEAAAYANLSLGLSFNLEAQRAAGASTIAPHIPRPRRPRCSARTRAGLFCARDSLPDRDLCWEHQQQMSGGDKSEENNEVRDEDKNRDGTAGRSVPAWTNPLRLLSEEPAMPSLSENLPNDPKSAPSTPVFSDGQSHGEAASKKEREINADQSRIKLPNKKLKRAQSAKRDTEVKPKESSAQRKMRYRALRQEMEKTESDHIEEDRNKQHALALAEGPLNANLLNTTQKLWTLGFIRPSRHEKKETHDPISVHPDARIGLHAPGQDRSKDREFQFSDVSDRQWGAKPMPWLPVALSEALKRGSLRVVCDGQSGSGKTHTMFNGSPTDQGIIPTVAEWLFDLETFTPADGCITIALSAIEVKALGKIDHGRAVASNGGKAEPQAGHTSFFWKEVNSGKEFQGFATDVMQRRTVSATAKNSKSSRSHLIFSVRVTIEHPAEHLGSGYWKPTTIMHFVDLAGSEKATDRDSNFIMVSRNIFQRCMIQIAQGSSHISFREALVRKSMSPARNYNGNGGRS